MLKHRLKFSLSSLLWDGAKKEPDGKDDII